MGPSSTSSEGITCSLPADLRQALREAGKQWDAAQKTALLWRHDASLWTGSDEDKWLDWLHVIERQLLDTSKFKALAAEVKEDGLNHVVVLGSASLPLAEESPSASSGKQNSCSELLVLKSLHPDQIREFRADIDPLRTLFCVSKADALLEYFVDEAKSLAGERGCRHFLAISEPGSGLEQVATQLGFDRVFRDEAHVRARFAAFTDSGMLPYAAAGFDAEKLLRRAGEMVAACRTEYAADNPGVALGLLLGTAAASLRRNKVTLICSAGFEPGSWLDELIAEAGGMVPVRGEPLLHPEAYATDRVFVYLKNAHSSERSLEEQVEELEQAGHPVVRLAVEDRYDIAQIVFQWQMASVVAASVMGTNPFQEIELDASEALTHRVESPILKQHGIQLFADPANADAIFRSSESLGGILRRHLDRLRARDYLGLLPHLPAGEESDEAIRQIRKQVVESKQVATTVNFCPPDEARASAGVFIQITHDPVQDLAVPGASTTFGQLMRARAQSELEFLQRKGCRVLRVHLSADISRGLAMLRDVICAAVEH